MIVVGGTGGGITLPSFLFTFSVPSVQQATIQRNRPACQQADFPLSQPINALNMIKNSMNNIDFRYINRVGKVFINEEKVEAVRTYHL